MRYALRHEDIATAKRHGHQPVFLDPRQYWNMKRPFLSLEGCLGSATPRHAPRCAATRLQTLFQAVQALLQASVLHALLGRVWSATLRGEALGARFGRHAPPRRLGYTMSHWPRGAALIYLKIVYFLWLGSARPGSARLGSVICLGGVCEREAFGDQLARGEGGALLETLVETRVSALGSNRASFT